MRPRGDADARADVAPDVVLIQEALGFLLYALTASFQAIAYAFANALDPIAHTLETSVRAFRKPDYGTLRLGRVGRDGWHLWPQDHGSEYDDGQKEYSHAGPYDFEAWIVPGVKACAFGATVPYSVTPVVGESS